MNPNVSIVVPVYNTRQYLQKAIESLLVQNEFIKEIIIVNDGSTDGSGELLEKLYGKDQLIKLLHTENNGQGYARNLGTSISTGDYIYYFDSDDIVEHNLFKKFNDILEENPTLELFCFSGQSFLDKDTSPNEIVNKGLLSGSSYKRKINKICNSGEVAFNLLIKNKGFFPGPPFYILKRSVLIKNNLNFNSIRYEDEEFTHKLFLYAGKTYITNDVLFKRRVRAGSTMQKRGKYSDIAGYFEVVNSLIELKKLNFISDKTKQTIEKRIINFLKLIIQLRTIKKISLSKDQKKNYKNFLKPYLSKYSNLKTFYYKFPFEYKIKNLKKRFFN